MRINIKHIVLTILAALPLYGHAQPGSVEIGVKDAVMQKSGGHLMVEFTAQTGHFAKDHKMTLVPVVHDNAGNTLAMESLTLAGRRKGISDRRAGFVSGDRRVVKGKESSEFRYIAAVPWQPWMDEISLTVYRFGEGCDGQYEEPAIVAAADRLIHYQAAPVFSREKLENPPAVEVRAFAAENPFLRPAATYGGRFDALANEAGSGSATVYFHVGKYDIAPYYRSNSRSLNAIADAFRIIQRDPSASLDKIFIAGFASPEGSLEMNTMLGQRRAEAVRDYLRRELGISVGVFEIYNGRENWDGLRRMVEQSDMPEREKVLYIIDSHTTGEEIRKQKLKYFAGGVPYSYMERHFFPELRSAGYVQIYYELTPQTVDTDGRDLAAAIDALNEASELMNQKEWALALASLQSVKEDSRAWNPMGVCCMMMEDYAAAERWLHMALGADDPYAAENLEQLGMMRRINK